MGVMKGTMTIAVPCLRGTKVEYIKKEIEAIVDTIRDYELEPA